MRAFVWLATIALLSSPAHADDVEVARDHFVQGSKAFDLGLYDKAVKEYMAAYDAKPDPALLYNIAQAHKLAGHTVEALRFYKVFLVRVPDAVNGDEVRAKIAELQRAIEQQRKALTMPPDQVKPLDSVETPAPTRAAAPVVAPVAPPIAPVAPPPPPPQPTLSERRPGHALELAGIAVGVVGVATLATGIGLSVVAAQDSDRTTMTARQQGVFDPGTDSSGRAFGIAGPALIGVGAALTITGGVVAILGLRASRRATATSAARAVDGARF